MAASYMASLGIAPHVISRILNHMETGVTAVYNRYSYDAEKRDALETWEKKIREIVRAPPDQPTPEPKEEPKPREPDGILTADQYAMLDGMQKMQR